MLIIGEGPERKQLEKYVATHELGDVVELVGRRSRDEIRECFRETLRTLLDDGSYVGIATHDEELIEDALGQIRARNLAPTEYEFQMLLGVRPELGDRLVREGHRLRVYVPFGRHWYEYSMRRLQENPRIAGYIASDTIGRFVPGRRNGI